MSMALGARLPSSVRMHIYMPSYIDEVNCFLTSINRHGIVAAFGGMHVSPAKHSYGSVTDGRIDRQTTDKVIAMCRYASQATQ